MDVKFLNTTLLQQLRNQGCADLPDDAARFNQTFSLESGEGYLLRFAGQLVVAERKIGDKEYRICMFEPGAPALHTLKRDGSRLTIEFTGNGRTFQAAPCFGEADSAEKLLHEWQAAAAAVPAEDVRDIPLPAMLFAAGLLLAAGADGELPREQSEMIRARLTTSALAAGQRYLSDHGFAEFTDDAKSALSMDQMLSLLANQLELMMCDGELRSAEMAFLKNEAVQLGVPLEEYRKLREFLLLKNQYPALFCL